MPEAAAGFDATVMAFDFGIKRIGIAIGELRLGSARALETLEAEANDVRFARIGALIKEWQPTRLLVGRPLNEDGTPHDMSLRCERFAHQLHGRFGLPVEAVDERFTSTAADEALREETPPRQRRLSWRERKARLDAEAARIILQSWMDSHAHAT